MHLMLGSRPSKFALYDYREKCELIKSIPTHANIGNQFHFEVQADLRLLDSSTKKITYNAFKQSTHIEMFDLLAIGGPF